MGKTEAMFLGPLRRRLGQWGDGASMEQSLELAMLHSSLDRIDELVLQL